MLTPRRSGWYRVAGGFARGGRRFAFIVSWRPAPGSWGLERRPDFNGYQTLRLGRLAVMVAASFHSDTHHTGNGPAGKELPAGPPRSDLTTRLEPYTMRPGPSSSTNPSSSSSTTT